MAERVARLSAMPSFVRQAHSLWKDAFNPRVLLDPNTPHRDLLMMAGSHRWELKATSKMVAPATDRVAVIDVALGLLERGTWTVPSWHLEQVFADRFNKILGWKLEERDADNGSLGHELVGMPADKHVYQGALVTGRWACEAQDVESKSIWDSVPPEIRGSEAERHFFLEVLVPVLGYPLLDFLQLQPEFCELGLDPIRFFKSRVDFALNSGRGIKLIIEIDGSQHDDAGDSANDESRDKALRIAGWDVWRVSSTRLGSTAQLQEELRCRMPSRNGMPAWGLVQEISEPRDRTLISCIWGATAVARIQFLVLDALRNGVIPWDGPWKLKVVEWDTDVADIALRDLRDWFGRLRRLHGYDDSNEIVMDSDRPDLLVDISIIQPLRQPFSLSGAALACSRPAQCDGGQFDRKYGRRLVLQSMPSAELVTSFVQDVFRKASLREGQYEIIAHIFMGKDVIGLLPTGAGKSLTYQLSGLLLGGLTLYVSPLRSLIQDQHERLTEMGISVASMLMSGIDHREDDAGLHARGARFLLLTPERFLIASFRDELIEYRALRGDVTQIVIDECHCVSEWGHEFRPAYLSLSRIARDRTRRLDVSAPLVALTGTASSIVLSDVMRELGIHASDAAVRARRLDRPEIDLICLPTKQSEKAKRISGLTKDFYRSSPGPRDGLLVFCPFVNGGDGVMGAAAAISEVLPDNAYRFYTGQAPDWKKYAAVKLRRRTGSLSEAQVADCKPSWADPDESWNQTKERWQREYISGTKDSFNVMIATKAFGMGIDKPSIREVIHWVAPASPEAYYQEIGRACRDQRPGNAILVFSDENATVTDRILDPGIDLDEAKVAYKEFQEKSKFGGGDFIRTFFFHDNSFAGRRPEIAALHNILSQLRTSVDKNERTLVVLGREDDLLPEYAIIRLILLGVIDDYTKDFRLRTLELIPCNDWLAVRNEAKELAPYYARHLREYVRRYQVSRRIEGEEAILDAETTENVESAAATAIISYIYTQVERKRRQASRQMLELARIGTIDPAAFRRDLLLYLQVSEKFTSSLEAMAKLATVSGWERLVEHVDQRDDLRELHGACQRVLESYPNHPALLFLSAVTRVDPSSDGIDRSTEEFRAAMQFGENLESLNQIKTVANTAVRLSGNLGERISAKFQETYGLWLIDKGFGDEALQSFATHQLVRTKWFKKLDNDLSNGFPKLRGI